MGELLSVCKKACEVEADYRRFPRSWLFHYRWGKGKSAAAMVEKHGDKDAKASYAALPDGSPIKFMQVGGRTTAYVPASQGKSPATSIYNKKRTSQCTKAPVAKRKRLR